jgi:aminoglycoside phosphotransferase (APT) family kinase protein
MNERRITAEELAQAETFGDCVPVYKVDAKTVVKTGSPVRLAEEETIRLVRDQTTIPVPEVYNAYTDTLTGETCIVMEFIEGERLDKAWDNFDEEQKQQVIEQLKDHFLQLREIGGSFIGSVDGTPCANQIFEDSEGQFGPYNDEGSLNEGIVTAIHSTITGGWVDTVSQMVVALVGHEIVLTHGDISPRNMLVQGTKIVAILDWELAGYYPEYWEYAKAFYRPAWEESWIKSGAVNRILNPYPWELAVMQHVNATGGW